MKIVLFFTRMFDHPVCVCVRSYACTTFATSTFSCKLLPPLSGKSGLTPWVRTTYEQSLRNFSIRKPRGADSQQLMSSGAWTVSRSLGFQHRLSEPPTALRASGGPGLHTITVWWSQSYQLIRDQSVAITAHALKRSTIQGWSPAFATAGSA